MLPIDFLLRVWEHSCQEGDFVFLATKSRSGKFTDHRFTFQRGIRRRLDEWFSRHPDREYDIYFCPTPFKQGRRLKQHVARVNLLWSDIDEGKAKIKPTILWESSPGRLQGLWFLDSILDPEPAQELNKALTYYNGADKGGWDLTQVLRVPGTKNHKYDSKPTVRIIEEDEDLEYSHKRIAKRIGFEKDAPKEEIKVDSGLTFEQVLSKHRRRIPPKVKQLLMQKHVTPGKRSDMLWFLENKLSEAGLTAPEIITLVKHSAWNKFKGRRDEDQRLKIELEKVIENNIDVPDPEDAEREADEEIAAELKVESYSDVMSATDASPGWLVKGFWMQESHGAIAGEPKSFKSTLAMDLAMAVASGKPFLNRFEVDTPGPVLYIQNENARWIMKDRMAKIATHKGLIGNVEREGDSTFDITFAPDMPLYLVNQQSFLLTDPIHQKQLVDLIKQIKPVLVILDPLYLMFDGDINSAKELAPVLSWLLEVRVQHKCGVILIHHWRKASGTDNTQGRGGQRMLGSTTIHGWIESAWYVTVDNDVDVAEERGSDDDFHGEKVNQAHAKAAVTIDREFRGAGLHPKIDLELQMGEMGKFEYDVNVELHRPKKQRKKGASLDEMDEEILNILFLRKNGVTEKVIGRDTGFKPEEVKSSVDRLTERGLAKREKGKVLAVSKV